MQAALRRTQYFFTVQMAKRSAVDQRIIIAELNIDHYRRKLATEQVEERRQQLVRLLAEEEAKLAALTRPSEAKKDNEE